MGTNLQAFCRHFYISCLKTHKKKNYFVKNKKKLNLNFFFFFFSNSGRAWINRAGRTPVRAGRSALRNRPSWNTTSIALSIYPNDAKKAEISPMYKKNDNLVKMNNRPVSILTALSKVFEGLLCDQLSMYIYELLSENLSAYRKHYSCQNCTFPKQLANHEKRSSSGLSGRTFAFQYFYEWLCVTIRKDLSRIQLCRW